MENEIENEDPVLITITNDEGKGVVSVLTTSAEEAEFIVLSTLRPLEDDDEDEDEAEIVITEKTAPEVYFLLEEISAKFRDKEDFGVDLMITAEIDGYLISMSSVPFDVTFH